MTTIAEKLTTINGALGDIKTAIEGKGVTPTGDITTYATAIGNISSGGSDGITREVSAQGVFRYPASDFTYKFPDGATDVGAYCMKYAFSNCTTLTGVDFNDLTAITGDSAFNFAFESCTGITSIDLSGLTVIGTESLDKAFFGCTGLTVVDLSGLITVGTSSLLQTFSGCTSLTSVNLSNLTTCDTSGFSRTFFGCTSLTSISFPKLTTITSNAFSYPFYNTTALANVYFGGLTTSSVSSASNAFATLMGVTGTSVTHTIHFPSNMESTIQTMNGYPLFGGESGYVTLAFDLPATS